jgi:hypothetical protein
VQSELPMSMTDRNGGSVYGFAAPATITLCPGATYKELVTSGTTESRLHNWINKSAICSAPAIASDGSLGYGNAGQSIAHGRGVRAFYAGLEGSVRVGIEASGRRCTNLGRGEKISG